MRYAIILMTIPALLSAQPFQQETNTIPVEINGWMPHSPWTRGYTYTDPELCDIDGDGDYDLFVGRDAYTVISDPGDVFFYENIGTPENPDFSIGSGELPDYRCRNRQHTRHYRFRFRW